MKKALKIFGITLGSVVGLVAVVVAAALYVVFTPQRLTPIVDKVAADYITCDYRLGDVDLTFYSTFPEFGLRADSILLINPKEGAQSDTLLYAKNVVARIEMMQLLKEGCLNIKEVAMNRVKLNAFIAEDGSTNYDIIALESDTTEEDTTEGFIRKVWIEDVHIAMDADNITLVDRRDTLAASLYSATVAMDAKENNDTLVIGNLQVDLPRLSASYKGEDYLANADIRLHVPYDMNLQLEGLSTISSASVRMDGATLDVNQFKVMMEGQMDVVPEVMMNMDLRTNTWNIGELLALVPDAIFEMPKDISLDGDADLYAHVEGVYNDSTWPLVNAHLGLTDATGKYAGLPYTLRNVEGDADIYLDLNKDQADATLNVLTADVRQSKFDITGRVTDILGRMFLDVNINTDLHLPDAYYFFPDGLKATGHANGDVKLKIALDDLADLRLTRGKIGANLDITNLNATMDSMRVKTPKANLAFQIPNQLRPADERAAARKKNVQFLNGTLQMSELDFRMTDGTAAQLGKTDVALQVNDIINNGDIIYADVDVQTAQLRAQMELKDDSTGHVSPVDATIQQPSLCAYVEYDTKDTLRIPTLECDFRMSKLNALYDTITVASTAPNGSASIRGGRRDKTQPRLKLHLNMDDLGARMGDWLTLTTGKLGIDASAHHRDGQDNILLEWNPRLQADVHHAVANLDGFEPQVKVPEIRFSYSNKDFTIDTSRIELGHSDFSLSGEVHNIGGWLRNDSILRGELNFTSSQANIDELLAYTSGLGSDDEDEEDVETEETLAAAENDSVKEPDPYIVPKGVDLTLNTHIGRAEAFGQTVRSLGGMIYVRDGVLVLEEVGFICDAATLQLTAMYKTPRKNHLYAGFDYHMTNIDVTELVNMIPQVDTLLPMLRAFKGAAEFHVAAETYLTAAYEPKWSTTRGALSIGAKDLTLLDGETFSKIAKILTFKKKTENKIDSISAEITLFKKQIDVYPLLVTCDKWMAAVGGEHYMDMSFDYHVSLLSPLYIGVDVGGTLDDLKIKPAKCRYAKDYRPLWNKAVDTQTADIRKLIREELTKKITK